MINFIFCIMSFKEMNKINYKLVIIIIMDKNLQDVIFKC